MSKQDTHFFNVFSMVIGLLVAVAIALFALARTVASHTQDLQVLSEIDYGKAVAARLQPPSAEAVSGQDNSALAIKAEVSIALLKDTVAQFPTYTEAFLKAIEQLDL